MVGILLVVDLHDHGADSHLQLTAAQHYKKASYRLSLAQEKNQNSKLEVWFLLSAYHFLTMIGKKKKIKSQTIVGKGPYLFSNLLPHLFV